MKTTSDTTGNSVKLPHRLSIGQQVLVALLTGVGCGVFLGEYAEGIGVIGDVYVGLLQMMVLPYIVLSLISGVGRLSMDQALKIAKYAVLVLLGMWVIITATIIALMNSFPEFESASFYSSSLIATTEPIQHIDIFISRNIFGSLAENRVPAIVVFCIVLGVALITVRNKQDLLKPIDVFSDAMQRVIHFVIKLTPVGVFAMTASTAGTITFEELGRLQGYFSGYTIAVLLLGCWVLPGVVISLTPFRYLDVIKAVWPAVVLAFAAGSVFIVLPLVFERLNALFKEYEIENEAATATAKVVVPIAYPFPGTGKLISLLFIPFTAWFVGTPMDSADFVSFMPVGILTYFGNVVVAMPFLLDYMKLPSDMFQLFLLTGIYCGRLSDALGAIDIFVLSTLVACAVAGLVRIQWRRLIMVVLGTVVIALASVSGLSTYNSLVFEDAYNKDQTVLSMELLTRQATSSVVAAEANSVPLPAGQSPLDRIRQRGVVRIGFHRDQLPYSYFNQAGNLVGFDIGMAHALALDLGVHIEFVPFEFDTLAQQLRLDHFDIAMAGIPGNIARSEQLNISDPYLFVTLGLVVPDHRDNDFASFDAIRSLGSVTFGLHRDFAYPLDRARSDLKTRAPEADLVVLDSYRDFFEQRGEGKGVDALITSAEGGSAWTLLYPRYQVVTPLGGDVSWPLVYPYSSDNARMDEFLDHWVMYVQRDGTVKQLYDRWILGRDAEPPKPRWSVIRNVLQWVD